MGAEPAHHPHVGLDAVPLQPGAVEDPVVGDDVLVVADLQAVCVAVEGVGVLHDELARAQHSGARARLVSLLDLEVVEDLREVAVGPHGLRDVGGDDLLVGHREHEVRALAVVELEELVDAVAPALLPELRGQQHRHEHLAAADGVDLLADDLDGALVGAPAGRQPGPESRADLADQPGSDHELVRERLRVGGRLLLGRQEVAREPRHRLAA